MAKWNPNAYPRRVLLHQKQLVQMIAEYQALNEWHAAYVFAKAMYGEEVGDVHIKPGGENRWNVEVSWLYRAKNGIDRQTPFWHSMAAHNTLYTDTPSPTLEQDILNLWIPTLPPSQLDWAHRDAPELSYTGPLAIPKLMETETTYTDKIGVTPTEYQRAVDRFTAMFPKVRVEPGLHASLGYFHWQYRTGQLSLVAVAERLNVFVFDLVQLWLTHDLEVYPEGDKGDYLIDPERLEHYLKEELTLYANDPDEIEYDAGTRTWSLWSAPRSAPEHKHIFMQAQIRNNRIIITLDHTDKPLFEALLHAGVPREQMIFAWLNNTRPLTWNREEGG